LLTTPSNKRSRRTDAAPRPDGPAREAADLRQEKAAPAEIAARLLPVVETLLRDKGYNGLNIREVAELTGMGPATIYKYFGSKERLALRVIKDQDSLIAAYVGERIPATGTAKQKWLAFYRALLGYYDDHPTAAAVQNIAMPTSTWFMPEDQWPVTSLTRVLRRLIQQGRESGELDAAVADNQIAATHYMHLVREVRLWWTRERRWRLTDRIDRFFPVIWKTISTPGK
jgi:AcrR family transcriptional regulator